MEEAWQTVYGQSFSAVITCLLIRLLARDCIYSSILSVDAPNPHQLQASMHRATWFMRIRLCNLCIQKIPLSKNWTCTYVIYNKCMHTGADA